MLGSCLPWDKSTVLEPDQLPANWPKGPSFEADPWVARLCALPSPPLKTKIVNAKAATRSITLARFECTGVIEILESFGNGPVDQQHPRHTLVPPMEQPEPRRGCHEAPLSVKMDWVGYEANSVGYGVDRRIFGRRRHCPSPLGR